VAGGGGGVSDRQRAKVAGCAERDGMDLQFQRGTVVAMGWPVLEDVARQLPGHPGADLPRGIAVTLKPIPGAPIGASIPDFPTGEPGPLVVPESRYTHRPASASPFSVATPAPSPVPARRPGPVEIRGGGNSILTFRCIPEIPAINRSSMTISITGEPAGDYSPRIIPGLDLTTDQAKAFLLALRDGRSPIVVADSRTAFQVEFAVTEDGPAFTVGKPGQERDLRRFNAGWDYDVKAMAADLLADLGP